MNSLNLDAISIKDHITEYRRNSAKENSWLKNSEQDYDILLAMTRTGTPMTAYAIGKEAEITVPQVNYRLTKLLDGGIVSKTFENNKTLYDIHPLFNSINTLDEIVGLLADIVKIIMKSGKINNYGIKKVLAFIVDRMEVFDTEDGEPKNE